jgi:hypothetical protein
VTWIATLRVCVLPDRPARGSRPVVGATVIAREGKPPGGARAVPCTRTEPPE